MTVLADPQALAPRRSGRARRLWRLHLRAHVAALAVVLLAFVPLIGTGSSFSADEGAAIVQARSLSSGDGWIVEHPLPDVDPTGDNYPLELSERGPRGTAPFAKHPLYALLLAGADRLAGVTGMVLLSLLGTVAAAGLAAALATRLDVAVGRPTLWIVGLGSPLFFDGYLVMAHSLGAAACAGAVLCAVTAIDRRSASLAAAVGLCLAVAVLLRSEALLLAAGLAVAAGAMAVRRRPAWPALAVAAAAGGGGVAARVGEKLWLRAIVGGAGDVAAVGAPGAGEGLQGRIDGFVLTWFTPNYSGNRVHGLLLLLMVAALAFAAMSARLHSGRGRRVVLAGSVAAVAATGALLVGPRMVVPGLLVTLPVAVAGLVLLGRRSLSSTDARLAMGTAGMFAAAVAATQYSTGGSGEWGGRYFALAIPVAVPVLVLGLYRQREDVGADVARRTVAALAICCVALSVMAVGSIRGGHRVTANLVAAVERATPEGAVVVTTYPAMPRFGWSIIESRRWLLTTPPDLDGVVARLAANGIHEFTFVTRDLARDRPQLTGLRVVSAHGRVDGSGPQVLTVDGG